MLIFSPDESVLLATVRTLRDNQRFSAVARCSSCGLVLAESNAVRTVTEAITGLVNILYQGIIQTDKPLTVEVSIQVLEVDSNIRV
jgi:uncharacterized Zn finger protein